MSNENTIVVLGGLGFLGSHICRALVAGGYDVQAFDLPNVSRSLITDIEDDIEIIEGDASKTTDVIAAIKGVHTVIHMIHTTVPGSSMREPIFDINSNVISTVGWLQRLPECGIKKIIYCSSGGTVYGVAQNTPIDENHQTNPISPYGISKLTIEKYVALYADLHNVDYQIVRPSNVFGVGQKLRGGQGVIGVMIDLVLSGKHFEIWGDGKTVRDYLYTEDLASAIQKLVSHSGDERVFNVSSGVGYSVLDIVSVVKDIIGPFEVRYREAGGFAVPINVLDSSRLEIATGWQAKTRFQDGIAETIEWVKGLK
jgi:UDP-glucose 4-epimerase